MRNQNGNACICCGARRALILDPHRCVRCVNERITWEDARSWLPLARDRIEMLEAERDLFRRETVALAKDALKLSDNEAEMRALREAVALAYGFLWRVNSEPGAPHQCSAEMAAYEARKVLGDTLTHEQRGAGISAAIATAVARNGIASFGTAERGL